jgi:hypothetical protein
VEVAGKAGAAVTTAVMKIRDEVIILLLALIGCKPHLVLTTMLDGRF